MIKVESTPGEGSCFQVFFPVAEGKIPENEEVEDQVNTGVERILFVDDEEMHTQLGKAMLESLGYTVVTKNTGIEALETFSNRPDFFDVVITDQSMPNMTGADLAKKLLQISPNLPVILCTGFSEIMSKEKAKAMGIREYLNKPYVMKDLAKMIQKVLGTS